VGTVVIVGAGAAGAAAAEMLRREGHDGGVLLLDPDERAPYDRPNLSKDFLAGSAPEEWLPLRPPGFFEEHRIDRVTASVERIDAEARRVRTSDGRDHAFDALLLATGSRAIRPGIPGEERSHVHVLRSLGDCRRIIEGAKQARHAVVVGASFIGMEVAASLRARDLEVTVVAPDSVPFERSLGKELGGALGELHESHGVAFRLGHTVREITEGEAALDDGTRLPADLVVLGVGVRPDTRLAEGAGIDVDDGVLVNEYLETSRPGIFAAGDIARWPDARSGHRVRFEHWATAQRLGQAAARNILGARLAVRDVPFFWTQQYDLGVRYVGDGGDWDAVTVDGDLGARDATVRYLRDGKMVGAATLHRDRESLAIEADLERAHGTR
jgi:NADPH-dependent 2,4-dienoyl-CoA reductase/sulfur reductase-like enzyme